MKRSSGVLVYRYHHNQLQVLLCHLGGPFFQNQDIGAWSIPKGEIQKEKIIDGALREFKEETGFLLEKENLKYLCSKKQKSKKLIIMFCTENDFDETKATSNTFIREYPKGSGIMVEFKEMNQAKWMDLEEAKEKIMIGQKYFLNRLEYVLTTSKK